MDVEIKGQKDNPLMQRKEVQFEVKGAAATPSRKEVKQALSEKLGVNEKMVVIEKISHAFGTREISGSARVYSDEKKAAHERKYVLDRDAGVKGKKGAAKEAKPAPKAEEKKEEKKG